MHRSNSAPTKPMVALQARVVLIYKKRDTGKYENDRPISFLNTICEIYAAILQKRLANTLGKHLQKAQI